MNRYLLCVFLTWSAAQLNAQLKNNAVRVNLYGMIGGNYGFPIGQRHVPVTVSTGPNPLLPVISGGVDRVPTFTYVSQAGVKFWITRLPKHSVHLGIGLSRRDKRLKYDAYSIEWGGQHYSQTLQEARISDTDVELVGMYSYAIGRFELAIGVLGIVWQKHVYTDHFLNGLESRSVNSATLRYAELYPLGLVSYELGEAGRSKFSPFLGLSKRVYDGGTVRWYDARFGVTISLNSKRN